MKEYIDKGALIGALERIEQECENAMFVPSWSNALIAIKKHSTITETEIRAKAIDEFVEKVKGMAYDKEYNIWTKDTMISVWESTIDEIAEQMKEVE